MAPTLQPIYTIDNCSPAYQLNWAVSLFGNQALPNPGPCVELAKPLLEQDGVRILEYRHLSAKVLALLISTKPSVSPARLLRVLKGRLQYAICEGQAKCFDAITGSKRGIRETRSDRTVRTCSWRNPTSISLRFATPRTGN
jgi:hypothetical protein